MEKTILSVSGRPGLYVMVSRGRGTLIVESIDEMKRRTAVSGRERVTALNEVSIYTLDEDKPLMEVFEAIRQRESGSPVPFSPNKASSKQLSDYMAQVLPNYDPDRVHQSDIKKLIQWYNILVKNGITDFVDEKKDDEKAAPSEASAEADAAKSQEAKPESK